MSIETLALKNSADTRAIGENFIEMSDITTEFFRGIGRAKLFDPENEYLSSLNGGKHMGMNNVLPTQSETDTDEEKKADDLSVSHSQSGKTRKRFSVIQKWEGTVIEVADDTLIAELKTIVGGEDDLIAEIIKEEVDTDDLALMKPGAVFYWSIGYLKQPSGTMRVSLIRFRRLPIWRKRQLQKAITEATKLKALLDAN
ncbi:hypothetical protein MNBD_CHLOROFLEXI01-5068 [hydrothermal vent metagenome]|uniref:Uncharacterized protein n=1 Tax=hydrothermal vent metagenome TaxID=652676 RepID=A0A3B0URU3_9ZZZZ